ncbi:MAG: ABC-type dipeptide/oligopeptide/nickel transport system, periplasmic component [Gaiellaceae bacterium]|nr:ABC-type dipeptide/oligopeptide/nickel transport system, periplasmic component [Gaiellaceae bacterium]
MSTRRRGKAIGAGALALVAAVIATSLGVAGAGAGEQSAFALPRAQTFYMSGSQWSPYGDVNPAKTWDYSTGTIGLAYETAFRFNPLTGAFIPWLATGGNWRTNSVYVMNIRRGVKFSDGKTLTPGDVKYSFDLLKAPTHPQNALWASTGLKTVKVVGNTVVFTFAGKPGYQQFDFYRYNVAIVPRHVFSKYSTTELMTGNLDADNIVGTGPYAYVSGASSTAQTFVWQRRAGWWATKALGLRPAPRYVVDIHNSSNQAALANFQAGNIDLFNNFAPRSAIKGKFKTFFNKAPYHLGANTTWLFPNTTKKPLNDPQFRRALAYSINMNQILDKAYQGLVDKASPTGLLPIWSKWVDKKVVAKYGFSYNLNRAKAILAAAGYKDTDDDGYVENKDGSDISLKIQCPNGWSDWMTSIQVIAESAKAAGIKITPGYPDYGTLVDDRGHARYDLVLANDRQYSNTPWTYYQYIFQLPILDNQTTVNYERFSSPKAWALTQQLDRTPTTNTKAYRAVMSKLQTTFLQNLPAIPLWYNGMWAMFNTTYWTNWPSATGGKYTPTAWNNYWQMTSIDMLTHLKPAKGN